MVEMVKATLNGEYEIILPKHRADRPEWYTEAGWEKPRLQSLMDNTNEGTVVYYVGAEEGEMCALLAKKGAKVTMFEPNYRVLPNIRAIWQANDLNLNEYVLVNFAGNENNGVLNPIKISDIEGEVIPDHAFEELKNPGNVSTIKIDDVIRLGGAVPDIISMDVEGSEFEVLRGAEQTLIDHKPLIYLSLHPEFLLDYGTTGREVRDWIITLGYDEWILDYQHEVHLLYTPKAQP